MALRQAHSEGLLGTPDELAAALHQLVEVDAVDRLAMGCLFVETEAAQEAGPVVEFILAGWRPGLHAKVAIARRIAARRSTRPDAAAMA